MGRKSSAKTQTRSTTPTAPPSKPRGFPLLPAVALVAVAIAVAAFMYVKRGDQSSTTQAAAPSAQSQPAAPQVAEVPEINRKPHPQKNLPPLPTQAFPPPRPPEVVRAAYVFAAEHPEVLSYVPCFCGCERSGHRGNEDCFVTGRAENGDVTQWEPHGLDCAVCIDVATQARQMYTSGASLPDIRAAVEKKYAGMNGGHTPTPQPPPSK
jgi:uncharacterized protein with PCYCGC motif